MKYFYFAAKYKYRQYLLPIMALLTMSEHTVQAKWLLGNSNGDGANEGTPEDKLDRANTDLNNIDGCTHFVLFNLPEEDPEPSKGRCIEYGYALAKGKKLIVIGDEHGSVFFERAHERFTTVAEFLKTYAPEGNL